MVNIKKEFGERLRGVRKSMGVSQIDLASKVGINYQHIGMIESGKGNPTLETIYSIAEGLKIPICELFIFGDAPDSPSGKLIYMLKDSPDIGYNNKILKIVKTLLQEN
ncbi:MAG: helix-turn-helix domain-containing protein [Fibrobacterota bacterium]